MPTAPVVDSRRATVRARRSDEDRTNPDRSPTNPLVRDALADLPPDTTPDRATTAFVETCLGAVADSAAAAADPTPAAC